MKGKFANKHYFHAVCFIATASLVMMVGIRAEAFSFLSLSSDFWNKAE